MLAEQTKHLADLTTVTIHPVDIIENGLPVDQQVEEMPVVPASIPATVDPGPSNPTPAAILAAPVSIGCLPEEPEASISVLAKRGPDRATSHDSTPSERRSEEDSNESDVSIDLTEPVTASAL